MNMNIMAAGLIIAWAGFGIVIDNSTETAGVLTYYISVPETSDQRNDAGVQMAGMYLAKRFKSTLQMLGNETVVVKVQIRQGEHWTDQKRQEAESMARRMLYGTKN